MTVPPSSFITASAFHTKKTYATNDVVLFFRTFEYQSVQPHGVVSLSRKSKYAKELP